MSDCLICAAPLIYSQSPHRLRCAVCGKIFAAEVRCTNGHYVCDGCHARGAFAVISAICASADNDDPYRIALEIMRSPAVHMHGPEHHVIVGSALAAAYCNATGQSEKLGNYLAIIEKRGKKVPGGTCGFWGACGAGIGVGIFLSVVLGNTPLKGDIYGLCNRLTARCLSVIGDIGGPRCCKRNVGLAIREAVAFVRENLAVGMLEPHIACEFSARNRECIGARCPFSTA